MAAGRSGCRAIDLSRRRSRTQNPMPDDGLFDESMLAILSRAPADVEPDDEREAESAGLFGLAEFVQQAVRARVDIATWRAFEMIAIEDRPVGEVARELGKKYTAVYNGYRRVDRLLRQEGDRYLTRRSTECEHTLNID